MIWDQEKLNELEKMLTGGSTLQMCGDHFGVTRQGIRYIQRKYFPHIKVSEQRKQLWLKAATERKQANILERKQNALRKVGREQWKITDPLLRAHKDAFVRKRVHAKRDGIEFDITIADIEWSTHCPVLDVELNWFATSGRAENSPSFDRIDPTKGYIPGNVRIISWRANRIKNDGTAEEHRKIAEWIEGFTRQ
jgi:hypothetical protein